ncbi:MAG: Ig-like domain-containing protein [Gammaproteobacteria bacterium]|nr:Ig-like domain-containing protein [Gammaproteobacteria bacterium]MBL7000389.1 cadherin-like domain-containing protein [Gammaproteobacteria bacterium]
MKNSLSIFKPLVIVFSLMLAACGGGGSSEKVSGNNFDPVAVSDSPSAIFQNATATEINVLSNDVDLDGDTLTVTAITQPTYGTATLNGGVVSYTPNANYIGFDTFTYTISDGNSSSDAASVSLQSSQHPLF